MKLSAVGWSHVQLVLLAIWMPLILPRTSACTIVGGNPAASEVRDSFSALCITNGCTNAIISGCKFVACVGNDACKNTDVNGAKAVQCTGTNDPAKPACWHDPQGTNSFEAECLYCPDPKDCGYTDQQTSVNYAVKFNGNPIPINAIFASCVEPAPCPACVAPSGGKTTACFSAKNTVEVQGKGVIFMTSLDIGDFVKTSNNDDTFSPVIAFMHKNPHAEVEYLQIYFDESPNPLEVSHDHFLFLNDGHKVIRAGDVKVNDLLAGRERNKGNKVVRIQIVKRRGLYAPVTESGKILVSNVAASSYVGILEDVAPIVQNYASHAALAPLRLAFAQRALFPSSGMDDAYSASGFSAFIMPLTKIGLGVNSLNATLQSFVLIVVMPFLLGLTAVEMMILADMFCLMLIIGFFGLALKNHRGKQMVCAM